MDRELHDHLDQLLDCCGIYSAIRDGSGTIVDFRVEYVNEAACRNNRLAADEQVGMRLRDILPSHFMTGLFGAYCRVVDTGQPFVRDRFQYRELYGDSVETRYFAIQATKYGDGFMATWRNMTESDQDRPARGSAAPDAAANLETTTDALRRERDRARQYLEVASVMIVGLDRDGKVLLVNPRACEVLGYPEPDILGKEWFEHFLPERCRVSVREVFRQIIAGNRAAVRYYENPVLTASGEERIIDWHNAEVRDDNGQIIGTLGSGMDITQRKQAEAAVQESEARFRATFEQAAVGMAELSAGGRWLRVNRKLCQILGYTAEELLQKTFQEITHPEDLAEDVEDAQRLVSGEIPTYSMEKRYIRKDGSTVWTHLTVSPLRHPGTQINSYIAVIKDIAERKQAEAALRAGEERLRAIVTTAADAIITIDEKGIVESFNPAAERMFGFPSEEVIGRNVRLLMPPPYAEKHDAYISRYLRTGEARVIGIGREATARRKDGSTFPIDLAISQVDHLGLFTGIIRDISEQKRLQEEVLRATEEEQRRLGQELHDDAQQRLSGLGMLAKSIALTLPADSVADLDERELRKLQQRADFLARGINEVNRRVHLLARGLVPSEIDAHGLHAAFAELAANTSELYSIACSFKGDNSIEVKDNFVATHLYRIAQEALNNTVKHAQADKVILSLERADAGILLTVRDYGIGLPADGAGKGRGLSIMSYRANLVGGILRIAPVQGGGTVVSCLLPVSDPQRSPPH